MAALSKSNKLTIWCLVLCFSAFCFQETLSRKSNYVPSENVLLIVQSNLGDVRQYFKDDVQDELSDYADDELVFIHLYFMAEMAVEKEMDITPDEGDFDIIFKRSETYSLSHIKNLEVEIFIDDLQVYQGKESVRFFKIMATKAKVASIIRKENESI